MPLINCEINLILTWSNRYFIINNPSKFLFQESYWRSDLPASIN